MTLAGFDFKSKRNPEKEIKMIDSLINGTYKGTAKAFEERKPGYKIVKNGGIECVNREELKAQEGIVMELMKSAGKTLMEGKNVVGISLPVRIFEPRSTMERICDGWAFGPIYLNRAAQTKVEFIVFFITIGSLRKIEKRCDILYGWSLYELQANEAIQSNFGRDLSSLVI